MGRTRPYKMWMWKNKERTRSWKIQRTEVVAFCRVTECQKKKSVCLEVSDRPCWMWGWGVVFKKVAFNHHSSTLLGFKWTAQPTGFYRDFTRELSGEMFTASYGPVILQKRINNL